MADPKKGALAQFMFPVYGSTDGSVLTTLTASDYNSGATRKWFGVNHGGSAAFTSGSISHTARLVSSGVIQETLNATENNYDMMMIRVTKTSAKRMLVTWQNCDNDDSDLMSALTVIQSMASDAASAAQQTNSRVLLNQSRISDIQSFLSDFQSDLSSHLDTTGVLLNASVMSDIRSAISNSPISITASDISDIASAVKVILASDLSDILSAAVQTNSRVLLAKSSLSDIQSFLSDFQSDLISHLDTTGVQLNASSISDLRSAIAAGPAATVTASDISDIASAVRAALVSDLSDILSAATQINSRALVAKSSLSDIQSFLSDMQSDLISHLDTTGVNLNASVMSDVRSAIAGGAAGALTASDISDIASAVKVILASDMSDILSAAVQINSRVLVNQSVVSDVYSMLSDMQSDFQSRVPKRVATDSQLSDLASDIKSAVQAPITASDLSDIASAVRTIVSSDLSDILSAATQINSRVSVNKSAISDIYSMLSDVQSDFQSRVPKRVATDSQLSDMASDLKSYLAGMSGVQSDIYSLLQAGVEIGASSMSDIRSAVLSNGLDSAGADVTTTPGVTASERAKLDWLFAMSRNKVTQNSTKATVTNDAGTTIASAVVSDDTVTFQRFEYG